MLRQPDDATIALDPAWRLNWLYFVNERVPADHFQPLPASRVDMAWDDLLDEEWSSWRQQLWTEIISADAEGASRNRGRIGCDAPSFASLSDTRAVRARCEQRWEQFQRWWSTDGAKRALVDLTMEPAAQERVQQARSRLQPDTTVTLHIVGLTVSHGLSFHRRHHDGRTVVNAAIIAAVLQDDARFRSETRNFTNPPPQG